MASRFRNRLELALKTDHEKLHTRLLEQHPQVFGGKWVADVRHTGSGRPALRYLARYVFRSALGPSGLLGYDKSGDIRPLCHESGTNRPHVIALPVDAFLKRWLTHVLPTGFVPMRQHGWMSEAARPTLPALRRGNEATRSDPTARATHLSQMIPSFHHSMPASRNLHPHRLGNDLLPHKFDPGGRLAGGCWQPARSPCF